jgi:hypothetical protein
VVLNFWFFALVEMKSVTFTFDHTIDEGLTLGDLTVFYFGLTKVSFTFTSTAKNLCANAPHDCPW